ncbi:MAG: pectate lyase [Bacteroidetes bacterium]|nr:pectate lyase [Bacteroidota bacterium]
MRTKLFYLTLFLFSFIFYSFSQNYSELPDYSGIEGFGFTTKGGFGGKIVKVTNLNKTGDGSLAKAFEMKEPRIVVFEVAGVIDLEESVLRINNPFITVAGQTAPGPGITIIKGGISITTHEVIIQHIRVRPGEAGHKKKDGWEIDGIATSQGAYNVIIDHCSATWATDENISPSGPRFEGANVEEWRKNTSHKILISNCIIAEGLSNSTHAKGEHSKGSLIHDNTTEIAIVGNLYASNMRRNPFFKGGSQGMFVNNYVFNPGRAAVHYNLSPQEWEGHEWVTGKMSVVNNVIEFGKDTPKEFSAGQFRGPVEVFWKGNQIISGLEELTGSHTLVDKMPVWPLGFSAINSEKVKEQTLQNAGARPWDRDDIDKRIIQQVKNGTNRIIDSEKEVGGYPEVKPVFRSFNDKEWDLEKMVKK